MDENDSLWWRVIEAKFDTVDRGWFTREGSRLHGNRNLHGKEGVPELHQMVD